MAKRSRFMHTPDQEERTPEVEREPILPEAAVAKEVIETSTTPPIPAKSDPAVVEWAVFGEHGSRSFTSVGDTLREVKHLLQAGCANVKIERR